VRLTDRIGKEIMLSVSYLVFLVTPVLMLFASNSAHAFVVAAVYGPYVGIAETVQRAVEPKYIVGRHRGTAYGLYNMGIGFSFLAANMIFGFLLDSSGITSAATYSTTISIVAIASLIAFHTLDKKF